MTPQERASYLIKELGIDKAIEHAEWASWKSLKHTTRDYWEQVIDILKQSKVAVK